MIPTMRKAQKMSFVLPAYNEAKNIPVIAERLQQVIAQLQIPQAEIIFVNDGSKDQTAQVVRDLGEKQSVIKLLSMAYNVGHQIACFAGIKAATGDIIITLDCDLQHPPEIIPQLYAKWQEGYDIVNTVRTDTVDSSFLKKTFSALYYNFLNSITTLHMVPNTADFRLIDARVREVLLTYEDRDIFLRGIIAKLHFRQYFLDYVAAARLYGTSQYSFKKMLKLAWSGIINFSGAPLKLGIYASMGAFFVAICHIVYELYEYFYGPKTPPGYITIVIMISVYAGITLLVLGIMGLYIGKIYQNSKHRPIYYIAEALNFSDKR